MSGSDRNKRSPHLGGFGLVSAVLLCTAIVGTISYHQGIESERRNNSPYQHAEGAKHYAERACAGLEVSAAAECVYEAVVASQENSRAEQDLEAQQGMRFWALVMGVVSTVTMLITAAALWYVKGTLDETRLMVGEAKEATNEMTRANDIARDAQRAWVKLVVEPVFATPENGHLTIAANIVLENIGKSTAVNIRKYIEYVDEIYPIPLHCGLNITGSTPVPAKEWLDKNRPGSTLIPSDSDPFCSTMYGQSFDEHGFFCKSLYVHVYYETDGQECYTEKIYSVSVVFGQRQRRIRLGDNGVRTPALSFREMFSRAT